MPSSSIWKRIARIISFALFVQVVLLYYPSKIRANTVTDASRNLTGRLFVPPDRWNGFPSFSPDGKLVVVQTSAEDSQTGKVHRRGLPLSTDVTETLIIRTSDFSVQCALQEPVHFSHWSPDGRFVAGTYWNCEGDSLVVYDSVNGRRIRKTSIERTIDFSWSPDSHELLIAQNQKLSICDFLNKQQSAIAIAGSSENVRWSKPCWSPDGKSMAALEDRGEMSRGISVWDSRGPQLKRSLNVDSTVGSICWAADGKCFAYSEPNRLHILDAGTLKEIVAIETTGARAAVFSWSPMGERLAFGDGDVVRIIEPHHLNHELRIKGRKNGVLNVTWSPDGNYILLDGCGTVAMCDSVDGHYIGFKKFPGAAFANWVPDGKSLLIENLNDGPHLLALHLPAVATHSVVIEGGSPGSPGWELGSAPESLEECFELFDKELSPAQIARFKNTPEQSLGDFGGGSWITDSMMINVYGAWGMYKLERMFLDKGIVDSRDVTSILLKTYWRRLNAKPLKTDDLIIEARAFWDAQLPLINENRILPESMLNCQTKDVQGGSFSIASEKARVKLVTFLSTKGAFSAARIAVLQQLRQKYSPEDLSIIVYVIQPENLSQRKWLGMKMDKMPQDQVEVKQIEKAILNFRLNHGANIHLSDAPAVLCRDLHQFAHVRRFTFFGPPQSLLITHSGLVKARLNCYETNAYELLERAIDNATKSAN